jgi:hypothetical protein
MRHNPNLVVYNGAYINKRVPFNVLSTILEWPSINSILYILTYISLIRNPRILVHVLNDVLIALLLDLDIVALK